jgi:hypothetical protein
MQLVIGLVLLVGALVAFWFSLPDNGRPRGFVGTQLESPIVIAILIAGGMGLLMTIMSVVT